MNASNPPERSDHLRRLALATFALGLCSVVLSSWPATVAFLGALVGAGVTFFPALRWWMANLDPSAPTEPSLGKATLRSLPPQPPSRIHELADNCVICGRPLTNLQSRAARVGSTCITRFGPRYKMVVNPEHEKWIELLAAAEADRAAEQARLNVAHTRALASHAKATQAWALEMKSPAAQVRRENRKVARRRMLLSAGAVPAGLAVGVATSAVLM